MDHVKLAQVLMNLVTNAVKYSGKGNRVLVSATATSRGVSNDMVRFHVTDEGPGIPPETQKHLFEQFRTFSPNSGAGIGLHITQVIVRRMGGVVRVISPLPGKNYGTRFEFTLCLTRSIANHESCEKPAGLKHGVRVLVADDEKVNCVILERKFLSPKSTELGWTTDSVHTLEAVLQKAITTKYDVILLDEHFGAGIVGSLFIDTLQKNGVKSKIFIASANCSTSDDQLYRRRGAAGTIPKPTPSIDVLLHMISSVL